MRFLVTGGAGFIGGHLAEQFLRDGHDVTVLDSMHPYYDIGLKKRTVDSCRELAAAVGRNYEFINGDIRNTDLVDSLVDRADYVYHQAARAGVRDSTEEPREYNQVNVQGTLNVLDAARRSGIERVVMASSSAVYGGRERYLPFSETDPTLPVSPYGASKLAAERYCCSYYEVYGLPSVALRYFTVYGPRMRPEMAISNFVSRCINGKGPIVYGDGTQTRDFTYITDIVRANRSLISTAAADGEAVNIGSTDSISIRALAEEVRDQLAPDARLEFAGRHEGDADHTRADISKAKARLDYEPQYTIRSGVTKYIEWYRDNRDWYEPLVLS